MVAQNSNLERSRNNAIFPSPHTPLGVGVWNCNGIRTVIPNLEVGDEGRCNMTEDTALNIQCDGRGGARLGARKPSPFSPPRPRLLDAKDAAAYMGVSETLIRQYVQTGKLPTVVLPDPYRRGRDVRKILIELSALDRFIDAHAGPGSGQC